MYDEYESNTGLRYVVDGNNVQDVAVLSVKPFRQYIGLVLYIATVFQLLLYPVKSEAAMILLRFGHCIIAPHLIATQQRRGMLSVMFLSRCQRRVYCGIFLFLDDDDICQF
jgi:hypothetical protein